MSATPDPIAETLDDIHGVLASQALTIEGMGKGIATIQADVAFLKATKEQALTRQAELDEARLKASERRFDILWGKNGWMKAIITAIAGILASVAAYYWGSGT